MTDIVKIWELLPPANPPVKLAIHLLSFVPSSASIERLFSLMGDMKTKKRNKMTTKKLQDVMYVKSDLRRRQAKDGTAWGRLKRHFGNSKQGGKTAKDNTRKAAADNVPLRSRIEDEEIVCTAEDSNVLEGQSDSESNDNGDGDGHDVNDGVREGLQSFSEFTRAMGAAADADSDGEDSGEVVETNPNTGPTQIACSFFLPHCQLLIRVFLKVRVFFWTEASNNHRGSI